MATQSKKKATPAKAGSKSKKSGTTKKAAPSIDPVQEQIEGLKNLLNEELAKNTEFVVQESANIVANLREKLRTLGAEDIP